MVANRIKLTDTILDAVLKMSEGNPGAATVLAHLTQKGLGAMQMCKLDDYGIYGARIWMCYKDLCGGDIDTLYTLLKENKLEDTIKAKCVDDNYFKQEWEFYRDRKGC